MPPFTKRVELSLGYSCNARCAFCCYKSRINKAKHELSTKEARKRLVTAYKSGAREIEFTGGEPSIRNDICELTAFARKTGFVNISMVTNGIRLADASLVHDIHQAGLNDIVFSIHGHTPHIHDSLTGSSGSFDKVLSAIENMKKNDIRIRSNTVLNGNNYRFAKPILQLLIDLQMKNINYIVFNPVVDAVSAEKSMFVKFSEAMNYIADAVASCSNRLPLFLVKYVPFCLAKGLDKHFMNLFQENYDPDEWHYYLSYKVNNKRPVLYAKMKFYLGLLTGLFMLKKSHFQHTFSWDAIRVNAISRSFQLINKCFLEQCRQCRYREVCEFPYKTYVNYFGSDEFVAVPGKKINDPVWCFDAMNRRTPGMPVDKN